MIESIICPVCKQLDRVEKVSSIIHTGTTKGEFTGTNWNVGSMGGHLMVSRGTVGMTGTNTTLLGSLLSPPPNPLIAISQRRSRWRIDIVFSAILFLLAFFVALGVNQPQPFDLFTVTNISFLVVFPGISITLLIICIIRGVYLKNARLAAVAQEPRWQQAMQQWSLLYYCYRDDVLFIPGSPGHYAPPKMMHQLL